MSTDTTPRSGLPLIAAAQAQKHVTHNEALLMLDALSSAHLLDRDSSAPPLAASDGDAYLVKPAGTGAWAGQDGNIAFALDGGWRFYRPYAGLVAYVVDEAALIVHDGSAWVNLASVLALQNVPLAGINTVADAANRLSVKSAAVLFDHDGAGMQAKLNKRAPADTASVLWQTNYSGRAEIGLTGDDNLRCKVSPDGTAWTAALTLDRVTGACGLAPGSSSVPQLTFGDAATGLYGVGPGKLGIAVGSLPAWAFAATGMVQSIAGGGNSKSSVLGEGATEQVVARYSNEATGPVLTLGKGRGTIAAPLPPVMNDALGQLRLCGHNGSTLAAAVRLRAVLVETGAVGPTAMGGQLRIDACPIGSATPIEVLRVDAASGLSLFGANTVIDQNRAHRLRATTIAGAIAPSMAGNLFFHSDAQGGAGEVAVDTGAAYRHAGQAAVQTLTADADATYTPRADGRIVRDSATLTADRKLVLSIANATDGHKVELSRRGAAGGHDRVVCQADGTTEIAAIADNSSADFIYDARAVLWFLK
jgi:hypothetical protein